MNDVTEYCKEITTYYMTDYDFLKESLIRCEKLKGTLIQMLEIKVNNLKKLIPEDSPKMGKVVRIGIVN